MSSNISHYLDIWLWLRAASKPIGAHWKHTSLITKKKFHFISLSNSLLFLILKRKVNRVSVTLCGLHHKLLEVDGAAATKQKDAA